MHKTLLKPEREFVLTDNSNDQDKPLSGLVWVERIAEILDSKFRVPGTNFRFGIDPLLGLVPFVGDITSFAISGYLIIFIAKKGISRKALILMILNVVVDTILGSIPLVGNIFDFTFRANRRNIRLLREHYEEGKYQGSGTGIVLLIAGILIGLLILISILFGWMLSVLINLF